MKLLAVCLLIACPVETNSYVEPRMKYLKKIKVKKLLEITFINQGKRNSLFMLFIEGNHKIIKNKRKLKIT